MKKFISILAALSILTSSAYAAVDFKTDFDNGTCTISGNTEEAAFNQTVSVIIKDSNGQNVHISYAETDNDGNFEYTLKLGDLPTGEYKLYVGAYNASKPIEPEKTIFYANSTDRATALEQINEAAREYKNGNLTLEEAINDILNVVSSSGKVLEVYNELYANADSGIKKALAEKTISSAPYAGVADFRDLFNSEFAVKMISAATEANIENVINVLWDVYDFENTSLYGMYGKLTDKQAVYKRLCGVSYSNMQTVRSGFEKSVLLEKLYESENIADAQELYDNYRAVFDFSYGAYPDWTTRDMAVASRKVYFKDVSALVSALDTAYAARNSGGSGGSGSGGGSSSWSGGSSSSGISSLPTQNILPQQGVFNDMQNAAWANTAVEYLYSNGIVAGNDDGGFEPARSISREEFVTMIVNAFGLLNENAQCDFNDVPSDNWSYKFVASAAEKGLVMGSGDGAFGAKDSITRQDMAVIIKRVADYAGKSYSEKREYSGFADSDSISDYAKDAVEYLYKCEILSGFEDGSFGALNTATRAEAAYVIYKIIL